MFETLKRLEKFNAEWKSGDDDMGREAGQPREYIAPEFQAMIDRENPARQGYMDLVDYLVNQKKGDTSNPRTSEIDQAELRLGEVFHDVVTGEELQLRVDMAKAEGGEDQEAELALKELNSKLESQAGMVEGESDEAYDYIHTHKALFSYVENVMRQSRVEGGDDFKIRGEVVSNLKIVGQVLNMESGVGVDEL